MQNSRSLILFRDLSIFSFGIEFLKLINYSYCLIFSPPERPILVRSKLRSNLSLLIGQPSTLRRRNLKTVFSLGNRIKCFQSVPRQTNSGHFGLVFEENSGREIRWLSPETSSFSKSLVSTSFIGSSLFLEKVRHKNQTITGGRHVESIEDKWV